MEKTINIIINNLAEMAYEDYSNGEIDYKHNETIKADKELDKMLGLDNLSENFDFKQAVTYAILSVEAEYERVGFIIKSGKEHSRL